VQGQYWLVYDLVPADARITGASIGLQFAPGARVEVEEGCAARATFSSGGCRVAFSSGLRDPVVLTGSLDPLGGWVSPRYGELVAAPQLRARIEADENACAFVILPTATEHLPDVCIHAEESAGSAIAFQIRVRQDIDTLFVKTEEAPEVVRLWDMEYDGWVCWVRRNSHRVKDARSLGGNVRAHGESVRVRGKETN